MADGPAAAGETRFGAHVSADGIRFAVWSGAATRMWVSIFDARGKRETDRLELSRGDGGVFSGFVPGLKEGARYGFRADGEYAPERGLWFDADKLLADPYAIEIDRQYVYDARLSARRGEGGDTAPLMPKAIAKASLEPVVHLPPLFGPGGLVYELNVRAFTMLHPAIPKRMRGTIAALGHPAIIEHLQKLGVSAVELMPVTAWIDERHLPPLGLTNAWGYNPVTFMALDPRLAPGGLAELRGTVAALRQAGIGVILDLVFNHTGESDVFGPTLSLRGLDARTYYRHREDGSLVNDTGTGNTIDCSQPVVRELILDSLRHFVAPRRRRRFPVRPRADPWARPARFRSAGASACRHRIGPGARRPRDDRRAVGYRPRRLPARQFSGEFPRMERSLSRRCAPLLARRSQYDRHACDAACRFVGYLRARRRQRPRAR